MPMYEFVCQECGHRKDIIVKFSEADDEQKCEKCEKTAMIRSETISRPGFQWRGRWHKTHGSY